MDHFLLDPPKSGVAGFEMLQIVKSIGSRAAVTAMAIVLMAVATSAQSKAFRVRFDPLFNLAFSGAVGQTVGWRGSATIAVDNGCLVPNSIQNVGFGPCASASLDGGLLTFYDTVPANGLGGIAWAGLLPAPLQLSIDGAGNVDGGGLPQRKLGRMGAGLVAARHEGRGLVLDRGQRRDDVLAALDAGRIAVGSDEDEVVVHHRKALHAETVRDEVAWFRANQPTQVPAQLAPSAR